jgi:hypothetical protein
VKRKRTGKQRPPAQGRSRRAERAERKVFGEYKQTVPQPRDIMTMIQKQLGVAEEQTNDGTGTSTTGS